jgi:hypothetical protein
MLPTDEQIKVAAYHLWEKRGRTHGGDRDDWERASKQLTYDWNYAPVQEFGLAEAAPRTVAATPIRRCRLCERDSRRVRFGPPTAVWPILPGSSLLSAAICQECQSECRNPLTSELERFWSSLRSFAPRRENCLDLAAERRLTLGAYKSLVAGALLILPERELSYFQDALEWVSNPDPDVDRRLFAGTCCRVYRIGDGDAAWLALARRIDAAAPLPYMMQFVSYQGVIVQIHLPLCSRDEDLAEGRATLPERPFHSGHASSFCEAPSVLVPLALPGDSGRLLKPRSLVECRRE